MKNSHIYKKAIKNFLKVYLGMKECHCSDVRCEFLQWVAAAHWNEDCDQ